MDELLGHSHRQHILWGVYILSRHVSYQKSAVTDLVLDCQIVFEIAPEIKMTQVSTGCYILPARHMNVNLAMIGWMGQLNIVADKEEVMFRPSRTCWCARLLNLAYF